MKKITEELKREWSKKMVALFDYVPMRCKATQRDWAVRQMVWGFKDGKNSVSVANLVAEQLVKNFGDLKNVVLVCVPAHNQEANEQRYKVFSDTISRLTGCMNAFSKVSVEGNRLAIHEYKLGKHIENTSVISFDESFFKGKNCIVFDDIITQGFSYGNFAATLTKIGANVLGGLFLAKTIK